MFSKLTLRAMAFIMKLAFLMKVVPYPWDSISSAMVGKLSTKNKVLFHVASFYYFSHISFLTIRAYQSYVDPSVTSTSFMLQLSLSVQSYMGFLIQLNSVFRLHCLKPFINSFIEYDRMLTAQFEETASRDWLGPMLWLFTFFGVSHATGFGFLFLTKPHMRHYYFSVTNLNEEWKYLFVIIEVLPTCYIWTCILIYLNMALMFMTSVDYWVNQLARIEAGKKPKTKSSLRIPKNFFLVYRSYQLLMHNFNYFLNFTAMQGQKLTNLGILVGTLYGTARFYDKLPLSAYVTFPALTCVSFGFANVAYQYGCIMNKASHKFRSSWLGVQKGENTSVPEIASTEILQFIASSRDLKMKMGNFYYYDETSARNFSQLGVDYAIGLLMAF